MYLRSAATAERASSRATTTTVIVSILVAVLVFATSTSSATRDCPQQEKKFNVDVQEKVIDIADISKDAEVQLGKSDELLQIRAGAGGRAKRARIVMRGVRGRVDLKWRSLDCRKPPCQAASPASEQTKTTESNSHRVKEVQPCAPGS